MPLLSFLLEDSPSFSSSSIHYKLSLKRSLAEHGIFLTGKKRSAMYFIDLSRLSSVAEMDNYLGVQTFLLERAWGDSSIEQLDRGTSPQSIIIWFSILDSQHILNLMEEFSYNGQAFKSQIYSSGISSFQLAMNNIPKIYILLLLPLFINLTLSFRFSLNSKTPQISLLFDVQGKQTFTAVSSGEEIHDVQVLIDYNKLHSIGIQVVFNKTGNDIEFTHNYNEGRINITVISTTGTDRNVSFDFFSEDDPLVKMIDKKDIKLVEEVLSNVHKSLTTISRNQQFHIQRDESHKATLQESESSIKWTGIVKIVFLLSSALIQLWIMKGFFKGNSNHPYQPVDTA